MSEFASNEPIISDPEDQLFARISDLKVHKSCWMNELIRIQLDGVLNPPASQKQNDYAKYCIAEIENISMVINHLTKR